jgi:hypothetical protein
MELRYVYGAGFGLMALGYGLGVVESLQTSGGPESVWLDGLLFLAMGFLAWRSLAGELDGLNGDESSVFLRPMGYILAGMGVLLTVLNGQSLTGTLL